MPWCPVALIRWTNVGTSKDFIKSGPALSAGWNQGGPSFSNPNPNPNASSTKVMGCIWEQEIGLAGAWVRSVKKKSVFLCPDLDGNLWCVKASYDILPTQCHLTQLLRFNFVLKAKVELGPCYRSNTSYSHCDLLSLIYMVFPLARLAGILFSWFLCVL